MSITGIQNPFFQTQAISNIQSQLVDLETQLGTGQVSQDYAGIGNSRGLAIALQSQLATISNYGDAINSVNVRLSSAQNALTAIGTSANQIQTLLPSSQFNLDQTGQTADQETADGQLQQVIDALNTQVGNTYIFSGTAATTPAVAPASEILNGNGAQAGLKQVISERAQADLGANGLGRLVIPPPGASPANVAGTTATLSPDNIASVAGTQSIAALSSAGGTLVINGQSVTINPGDNAAAIVADIKSQTGATGVTASLDPTGHLVLQSANSTTAIAIGGASSGSLLTELGLSAATTNPTNLITQGAVANNDQLVVTVGANPALTITFGTGAGQISTLQGLNQALGTLAGGTASVNTTNGNISITALNTTDQITTAFTGTGPLSNFGISAGTTSPTAGTRVSLSEDVAGSVFGLKIAGISSTLTGATVAGPTGSPASTSVDLGANPNAGDTLTYSFNLPDGTTQQLTLTATTASPPGTNQFTIGTTPAATATNLQAALTTAVTTLGATSLTAASAVAAANEFFNSGAASPPLRVNGPPFSTATSLIAGTSANTLSWYTGDAGATSARSTATAQIDPSITVSFGMRANEPALLNTVENLAVFSAMSFSASDPNAAARYTALTQRINTNMSIPNGSQTVTDIEADIAGAQTAVQTATTNHTQTSATLTDMVQNIEGANTDDVGSQILDLQTRLQASLQVTAMLAKTNLVSLLPAAGA
jgi:flagellin-like hook-associated protein FlgL